MFIFAVRGFYLFRNGCNLFWRWISSLPGQSEANEKDHWGTLSLSLPRDGYGGGTTHPLEGSLIKCELHIRMYYFQPQKYLPKNQGSWSTGQKENSHGSESWRRPGHTPRTGYDGMLHYDVLPPGNHTAAFIYAEVNLYCYPVSSLSASAHFTWVPTLTFFFFYGFPSSQARPDSAPSYTSISQESPHQNQGSYAGISIMSMYADYWLYILTSV